MKKLFLAITLILVGTVCWGQDYNTNGELIREIFENKNNKNYDGYGIEKHKNYLGHERISIDYEAIGLLYVAGCHPEYLEKYGKGYKIKKGGTVYGDYLVTGGNFGTPVKCARTARKVYSYYNADNIYNQCFRKIGEILERLYEYENRELTEAELYMANSKYRSLNYAMNEIKKLNRKAEKEKEKVKVGQLF